VKEKKSRLRNAKLSKNVVLKGNERCQMVLLGCQFCGGKSNIFSPNGGSKSSKE